MNAHETPMLVAQSGPLDGQHIALDHPLVFGRDSGCDIIIADRQISRYHARLTPTPEGIILEDLGSKNGTFCNGTQIQTPVVLQDGDTVQIGLTQTLLFLSSDATMPLDEPSRSGRLMLDSRSRRVWVLQQQLTPPLSALQFHLLWVLYENQGEVVTRQELISAVWGDEQAAGVTDQALDALLRRLRERLSSLDPQTNFIVTVRGHGIRLDNPV
jgi:pSer/pThr/pTyr-binding forkhead associated (FHA) protein